MPPYYLERKLMNSKKMLLAYLALAAVCIIWGTTYLAIRIGVVGFPAFLFSGIRQIIAGIILTGFMLSIGKAKWPTGKELLVQALGGFFMITLGNGLVGYGEVYVSSGLAAIICSIMPIWVILINLYVNKDERPTLPVIAGLIIGLSGIVLIFKEHLAEFSNTAYTWGIVVIFVANLGWAVGSVWMKRKNQNTNPFLNAGLQMFFGGVFMLPASLAFDDLTSIQWTADVLYAMGYLIVMGSIIAYACYSYAITQLPITIVSMYAYINPLVAVLLGWAWLNEKLNLTISAAMLVTVAGIYLVNRGYQARSVPKVQLSKQTS
jgi:drug/metabolite transporter (DMT)-like permease